MGYCSQMEYSIYRLRSTQALLDRFHELENQEIYFASPAELNDPLEGFKDLLWRGDVIVWSNLLRHYLLCLMQAVLRTLEHGPNYQLTEDTLPVAMIPEDLHPEVRKVFDLLCKRFFEDAELSELPGLLAGRTSPIRRSELLSLLWPLHSRLFLLVCTTLSPDQPVHAIDASFRAQPKRPLRLRESFAQFNQMDMKRADSADIMEVMAARVVSAIAQTIFILEYNARQSPGTAWQVIGATFPEIYTNALERLLYDDWYTACFVAEPTQAAMWGQYGDGHRGACLKFKTSALSSGSRALTLNLPVGIGVTAKGSSLVHEFRPVELHEVQYRDCCAEIDFFRSLGRLTHRQGAFWFGGANGAMSPTGVDLLQESDEWRRTYWESFHSAVTTKLKDWQNEREYRATLQSGIDLSDRASRKLRYRFEDLQAVIFGMKTSTEDKLAIVHLIQDKCKQTGRKDFKFHQTYYSRRTGKIDTTPWDLVKAT